jgi:hypothetical protein
MGLFDNGIEVGTGFLIGLGAIVLAPIVVPVFAAVAKPLVKAGIKSGLLLYDKGREIVAEAQEVIEDLTAEVKAELNEEHEAAVPVAIPQTETSGNPL